MPFKKGKSGNPAGSKPGGNPGSGRTPDWLKAHTRDIIEKDELVERLALIARGDNIDQPLSNGEVVPIPAPVAEQRKAILDLLDRGYGKPHQSVEVSGDPTSELAAIPTGVFVEVIAALKGGTSCGS
jgi:hypothetical protein